MFISIITPTILNAHFRMLQAFGFEGLNQHPGQARQSTGPLQSGPHGLECHTRLSKKAGGKMRLDAEKIKVLTR